MGGKELAHSYHFPGTKRSYALHKERIFPAIEYERDISRKDILDRASQDNGTSQLRSGTIHQLVELWRARLGPQV